MTTQILRRALATCAIALTGLAAQAGIITVTPTDLQGWSPANVRTDASVAITGNQPRSGNGSLEFVTNTVTSGQDKADFVLYTAAPGGFGLLSDLNSLSFDSYRNSTSTAPQHYLPAFRVAVFDTATNQSGLLIWEDVYNGGSVGSPVLTDQWVGHDVIADNFWLRAFGPGRTAEDYDITLAQWAAGMTPNPQPSPAVLPFNAATTIITGFEVGVGSGWGGTFDGFVDNVNFGFAGSDATTYNFELDATDPTVPEPATLSLIGLGLAAGAIRRRKAAKR